MKLVWILELHLELFFLPHVCTSVSDSCAFPDPTLTSACILPFLLRPTVQMELSLPKD